MKVDKVYIYNYIYIYNTLFKAIIGLSVLAASPDTPAVRMEHYI